VTHSLCIDDQHAVNLNLLARHADAVVLEVTGPLAHAHAEQMCVSLAQLAVHCCWV
jgi:hypothetical protein